MIAINKLPPIEKIVEAYSAIEDQRVTLAENQATVRSSNGAKEYTVFWNGSVYSSNDNATYWQGYAGYPVIAVLMLQGKLPLNRKISGLFGNVNWTELNQKYQREYSRAVDEVLKSRERTSFELEQVTAETNAVYEKLKELDITIKRGSLRPPKGK